MAILDRGIATTLREALANFPAVLLHGARQTGKTTLLRTALGGTHAYVSVEQPRMRKLAVEDPAGFLDLYRPPVVFDEIQYAPGLLPYIKERIDSERDAKGQYVLTGSQNLLLLEQVSESLAGRVAVLQLYPLANRELQGDPDRPLPWHTGVDIREYDPDGWVKRVSFCEQLLTGGFPDVALGPPANRSLWFESYVTTYLERDVRNMRQIGDLAQFQNFMMALALRCGQLLNLSDLAGDLGVAVNTIKAWLSVLAASGLTVTVRHYFENRGKRLVKAPKVYWADTGLLCHLAGLQTAEELALSPLGGGVMETAVLLEMVKAISCRGRRPEVYFWRTSNGTEVDFVIRDGPRLIPVEAKISATPKSSMANGMRRFRETYADSSASGWLIYAGDLPLPLGDGNLALPFNAL